jgi:GNAT superfamily N-acetyltransferase
MDDTLHIREATKADLPDLMRLYAQPDLDGKALPVPDAQRIFERIARYPDYKIHVAVSGTHVVGTFALLIMDNLGHQGTPSAIIEDVAVDPARHGQGIGKAMMRHALRLASESGCYKAVLSSNLKREKAHAFYDSLGFERHGYSFRVDLR